jgi:hypothetical protein
MAAITKELTMSTITLRIPNTKHERLKNLAHGKNISLNKMFEEWATVALVQQDTQASYDSSKARGNRQRGLALLDTLDKRLTT